MKKLLFIIACSLFFSGCKGGLAKKLIGTDEDKPASYETNPTYLHHQSPIPYHIGKNFCLQYPEECEYLKNNPDVIFDCKEFQYGYFT
jgi:hypothetical protein